jgi:hypothetical protein
MDEEDHEGLQAQGEPQTHEPLGARGGAHLLSSPGRAPAGLGLSQLFHAEHVQDGQSGPPERLPGPASGRARQLVPANGRLSSVRPESDEVSGGG